MTQPVEASDVAPVRCSDAARALGGEPVGSVDCTESLLIVEWPKPWPRAADEVEALGELAAEIAELRRAGRAVRLQLVSTSLVSTSLVSTSLVSTSEDLPHRVVKLFRRPKHSFSGFSSVDRTVPPERVVDVASELLRVDWGSMTDAAATHVTDVLVCGHGSRDTCCGSLGTRLVRELGASDAIRVWTTTHLGGHRYAPTATVFPFGTVWGFLDAESLAGVVSGDLSPASVRRTYRGNFGFCHPIAHVAEREALIRFGFEWLRYARSIDAYQEQGQGEGRSAVARLRFRSPAGVEGVVHVAAERVHLGDLAPCRSDGPTSPEFTWVLRQFDVVGAASDGPGEPSSDGGIVVREPAEDSGDIQ